jgi:paraquat-inducible protein B
MSKRANPARIGLFILLTLALTVFGVATLVPGLWSRDRPVFVSYFEETVTGLEPGASVTFQGVPVGNVIDIGVLVDPQGMRSSAPVRYRVDLRRLRAAGQGFVDLEDEATLRAHVAGGLRAQLQVESIVTGLLIVNLGYVEDPPPVTLAVQAAHPVIPTAPSTFLALEAEARDLSAAAQRVLAAAGSILEDLDAEEFSRALVASAQAVERLAGAPEIRAALVGIPGATEQFGLTLGEIRLLSERLGGAVGPLEAQLGATTAEAVLALQAVRETMEAARAATGTDAGLGFRVEEALVSLTRAADAIRQLVTAIEQDPGTLLRGRRPNE